jgi:hypothetical protein
VSLASLRVFLLLFSIFFLSHSSSLFCTRTSKQNKTHKQWLKNLTEEDFLAASVAAATEATDADAAATEAAAEAEAAVAAEAAAEGRTTRTSGPRARSWGDWYKRYVCAHL